MTTQAEGAPLRGNRRPTLYDVAKLAGVSHQTVSAVVNGGPNVRDRTRERVEVAIAELGYQPNLAARALASARSQRIGALFFDRYDEIGPTRNVQAAIDTARDAGYLVDVIGVEATRPDQVERAITLSLQAGVAGIAVFAPTREAVQLIEQRELPVPVVIESSIRPPDDEPAIGMDGVQLIVEHLAALGHTRIAHISGPLSWVPAQGRIQSAHEAARRFGMQVVDVEGGWTAESGYRATRSLDLTDITAVFASNDQMALGAIKAVRETGRAVPGDMSVAGYDDVPESGYFEPALTTVAEDFEGRGRLVMTRLLEQIDTEHTAGARWYEPPRLVVRASTAAPAH